MPTIPNPEIPPSRVRLVRRMVRGEYRKLLALPVDARALYVYGALVASDIGRITKDQLEPPFDPSASAWVDKIMAEFNLVGIDN